MAELVNQNRKEDADGADQRHLGHVGIPAEDQSEKPERGMNADRDAEDVHPEVEGSGLGEHGGRYFVRGAIGRG